MGGSPSTFANPKPDYFPNSTPSNSMDGISAPKPDYFPNTLATPKPDYFPNSSSNTLAYPKPDYFPNSSPSNIVNTDSPPVAGTTNQMNQATGSSLPQGMSGLGGIPTQFTPQVSAGSTFTPPTTNQPSAGTQPQQGSMSLFGGFQQPGSNQLSSNQMNILRQLMWY